MSPRSTRLVVLVLLAGSMTVAIAAAQQREPDQPGALPPPIRVEPAFNPVDGRIRVLSLRPEGEHVNRGDVVCELDPASLNDQIDAQQLDVQALHAGVQGARLAREAAVMELNVFKEGRLPRDITAAESAVKVAEEDLVRNEDKLEWARRMFEKGYVAKAEKVAMELSFQKARYTLEAAQIAKLVTIGQREKTTKTLMSAVETARERELKKEAELHRAEASLRSLRDQLRRCKVTAPCSGRIAYEDATRPGVVAQDGQILFLVFPDNAPTGTSK